MHRAFWALASPSSASGQELDTTCHFLLTRLDPAIPNTLAVDTHAVYWASSYTAAPGIFANRDIDYVYAPISRGFGELLVFRGRAPTFADTRGGVPTFPSA